MTELLFWSFSTPTNIVPCVVNLIALSKRFEITCEILPLSACIKISFELYENLIFSFLAKSLLKASEISIIFHVLTLHNSKLVLSLLVDFG
jgi:hypothetical protein